MLAFGILYAIPFAINTGEGYRTELTQALSKATGQQAAVRGELSMVYVPFPKLIANDVYFYPTAADAAATKKSDSEHQFATIKTLEVGLSPIALLSGSTTISTLTLTQPAADWRSFRRLQERDMAGSGAGNMPKKIIIRQGTLHFYREQQQEAEQITDINTVIDLSSRETSTEFDGSFTAHHNTFQFEGEVPANAGEKTAEWTLKGDYIDLTFNGSKAVINGEDTLTGHVTGKGDDVTTFLLGYFSGNSAGFESNEKAQESFEFTSNLRINSKVISFSGINLSSGSLKGKGDVKVILSRDMPEMDISLLFDRIDINSFLETASHRKQDKANLSAEQMFNDAIDQGGLYKVINDASTAIAKKMNIIADISINELVYKQDKIEKLILQADMFNGEMVINQFTAYLPGKSVVEIYGTMSSNDVRPRFNGEVLLSGEGARSILTWAGVDVSSVPTQLLGRFKTSSDITIMPQKIYLSGIDLMVDDVQISGSLMVRRGQDHYKVSTSFRSNMLNLDQYNVTDKLAAFIKQYYIGDPNKKNTQNFGWLRRLGMEVDFELICDRLLLNKEHYKNANVVISAGPGNFNVEKLGFVSDSLTLDGYALMDITSFRPRIDVNVMIDHMDTTQFAPTIETKTIAPKENPTATETSWNGNYNDIEPAAGEDGNAETITTAYPWLLPDISGWGLDRMDGTFKLFLKDVIYPSLTLKELTIDGRLEEGMLQLSSLKGKGEYGEVDANGIINVAGPSYAISFALSNFGIEEIAPLLWPDIKDKFTGYMSLGGSISTQGKTRADYIKSLKGNLTFAARSAEVKGIDLHQLIEEGLEAHTVAALNQIAQEAATTGSTVFESADSKVVINDGVADITGLQLATSRATGVMTGRFDLNNGLMNTLTQFAFMAPPSNQTVNTQFLLSGNVHNPDTRKFDLNALMTFKGFATAQEQEQQPQQ